jgi:hypothetical protein
VLDGDAAAKPLGSCVGTDLALDGHGGRVATDSFKAYGDFRHPWLDSALPRIVGGLGSQSLLSATKARLPRSYAACSGKLPILG